MTTGKNTGSSFQTTLVISRQGLFTQSTVWMQPSKIQTDLCSVRVNHRPSYAWCKIFGQRSSAVETNSQTHNQRSKNTIFLRFKVHISSAPRVPKFAQASQNLPDWPARMRPLYSTTVTQWTFVIHLRRAEQPPSRTHQPCPLRY